MGYSSLTDSAAHRWVYSAAILYAALVAVTVYHHEPWADEAQAWLLARDSNLTDLWMRLLHYEGTPGLWHTLLHGLTRLGVPYAGLNVVSGLLGFAAAWLFLRYAPLPLRIRVLIPFTFYLSYQYAVVARSYSLLPPLLFVCALLHRQAAQRPWLFTAVLVLLAAVSLQGFLISVSIWLLFCIALPRSWRTTGKPHSAQWLTAGALYLAAASLLAISAWPAPDAAFIGGFNGSPEYLWAATRATFSQAFTGEWLSSFALVGLSAPFLWRGGSLPVFLLSSTLLCVAGAVIYSNVWHQGLVFLVWLFAIWLAAARTQVTLMATASLLLIALVQGYWTVQTVRYEWSHPYSGSQEAARFLQQAHLVPGQVQATNFSCTALQPYFPNNPFLSADGGKPAYWLWDRLNRVSDPVQVFLPKRATYLLVGYERVAEQTRWAELARLGGYQLQKQFHGSLFWHTEPLEPESFDLYRRVPARNAPPLASELNMVDPATANQLLSGFYTPEGGVWRWSSKTFAVVLQSPVEAPQQGATLALRFHLPEGHFRALGSLTVSAEVAGQPVGLQSFIHPGEHRYVQPVPASALQTRLVPVRFHLDKAMPPSGRERRELGTLVVSIALESKP